MTILEQSILRELYFSKKQSIAELSLAIGKSVPNITKSLNHLISKRIVKSEGPAPSTGGRRALLFALNNKELPNILAIAIDQFNISIALVDLSNHPILEQANFPIELNKDKNIDQTIIQYIENYIQHLSSYNILAIGLTMPGFVNADLGINTSYPENHPLYNLKSRIQTHFNTPCYIENDSTSIAIAEYKFGEAIGINNALIVNLNWGVGLGMILEGKLFKGSNGFAGEFSHIPLSNLNKLCSCGKRGCLEVEASLSSALENVENKLENGEISKLSHHYLTDKKIDIASLMNAANSGDQVAIASFSPIGYMLGKGIATLIHIINPEVIIISGRGSEIGGILLPRIQSSILEFSIQKLSKYSSIKISKLKNAQIIGSAAIAIASLDWKTLNNKIKF